MDSTSLNGPAGAFIEASVWYGAIEKAEAILASHPWISGSSIYAAAILGDDAAVSRFTGTDPRSASAAGGPLGWDPLTYLCFSKYLRLDRSREKSFLRTALHLLDAGANAATGFYDTKHQPVPEWESALYGAAGVAHNAALTKLLLDRGADPNDEEVPYHSPETYDNSALKVLIESKKLTAESLSTLLLRKADWHDYEGIALLLAAGADPNRMTRWHYSAFQQAVRRDNALQHIEIMLDYGADPALRNRWDDRSAASMAARRGRKDALLLFEQRGFPIAFAGIERLIAACAMNDETMIRHIAETEPFIRDLIAQGGTLLAEFAGTANTAGVGCLLDLGIDIDVPYMEGDGYFGIARGSTALHVAAWRAAHPTVALLIDRGATVNAIDSNGQTPLALAVRACVDSYWQQRRSPESVKSLLAAGAAVRGISFPTGYDAIDRLLEEYYKTDNTGSK